MSDLDFTALGWFLGNKCPLRKTTEQLDAIEEYNGGLIREVSIGELCRLIWTLKGVKMQFIIDDFDISSGCPIYGPSSEKINADVTKTIVLPLPKQRICAYFPGKSEGESYSSPSGDSGYVISTSLTIHQVYYDTDLGNYTLSLQVYATSNCYGLCDIYEGVKHYVEHYCEFTTTPDSPMADYAPLEVTIAGYPIRLQFSVGYGSLTPYDYSPMGAFRLSVTDTTYYT